MQAYVISDRGFHVGPGALMLISAAQAADRAHRVEVVEEARKGAAFVLVKAKDVQQFKCGELLGVTGMPKGLAHMAEPVGPGRKGSPEALLVKACEDFRKAAEEIELQSQIALEEAEKKKAAAQAEEALKAQVAEWTSEWQANEAIKEKYPKVDDYVAARQKEAAKAAA